MFKANSKKWLTRLSSFILTLAISTTAIPLTSLTVQARDGDVSGDNGNLTSLPANTKYFPMGFNEQRQGYRFYVIDNQGNCVSKVVDFVYEDPSSIVRNQNLYTNPRWTPLSTDKSNYKRYMISELQSKYCAGAIPGGGYDITSDELRPVDIDSGDGAGAKFQLWFLGEEGRGSIGEEGRGSIGDTNYPSGSSGGSNGGGSGGGANKNNQKNQTEDVPKLTSEDLTYLEDIFADDPDQLEDVYRQLDAGDSILKNMSFKSAQEIIEDTDSMSSSAANNMKKYIRKANQTYKATYNSSRDVGFKTTDAVINAIGATYVALLRAGATSNIAKALACLRVKGELTVSSLHNTSEDLLNTNIPLSNLESLDNLDSTDNDSVIESFESMGININTLSNILDVQIPLAEAEQTKYNYPIDRFITWEPNDKSLPSPFNVKGFTQDLSGNGSVTLLDALKYKEDGKFKYGIIVEPIFWAGMYGSRTSYENWYTYGTYYNILQYYVERLGNKTGAGCHYSYMRQYGKNSMIVAEEVKDFGLKPATNQQPMALNDILSAIEGKEGYGMHFYYKGNLPDSSSSTSTYDEPLGTTIGQAPDPSTLPEETDYPVSKNITIIKNYVTREESIGTEVVDGNFIRQQNPHIIDIEDEPEYTVVQWETSTHLPPPSIQNGSTLETYDDLTVSSDSIQSGSSSENAVTLTDKEFILYVKLIFNL